MLVHYFKMAVRNLLKYKTQNLICILGLATGILCFTFCLYSTRFVFSTNSCFENNGRIVQLRMFDPVREHYFSGTSAVLAEQLQYMDIPQIEGITRIPFTNTFPFNVQVSENEVLPYNLVLPETDTLFNTVFRPNIIAGSWESAAMQQNAIILSKSTAGKIFGKYTDALGKTFVLAKRRNNKATPKNGGVAYHVAAIMADIPLNNTISFMSHIDGFSVNDTEGLLQWDKRGEFTGSDTYVLLGRNVSPEELENRLEEMGYVFRLYDDDYKICAERPEAPEEMVIVAWITFGTGVLILVISLLNFFNFLVSFFYTRTKEYTVRKVFGSNRKQLFLQLYAHVIVMVLLSGLAMLSMVELFGDNIRIPFDILEMEMQFSRSMLLEHSLQYILLLLVASAVICRLTVHRIHRMTAHSGISSKPAGRSVVGRNAMLWWQLFITWIFIGAVWALAMQSHTSTGKLFPTLSNKEKKEILSIPMDFSFLNNAAKQDMVSRFKEHPGVEDVIVADISLVEGYSGYTSLHWEGEKDKPWFETGLFVFPENFFSFMNIPLLQGRLPVAENEVMVDSRFAELRKVDVVGKNAFSDRDHYTICGVGGAHDFSIYDHSPGFVYIPRKDGEYIGHCYLKCHPAQVDEVRSSVAGILRKELPASVEFEINTFLDDVHEMQVVEYTLRKVFIFFAVVCVILTLLGVYSSISFDTLRRQKEVALRKINGAGKLHIAWVFIRLYAILLVSSAAVAFPLLHLAFGYWKQMYIHFFECGLFFWVVLFITLTAMVAFTIAWKIGRIVRLNPAEVIKSE